MSEKKKSIILVTIALAFSLVITMIAVYLYKNLNATTIENRMIQNVTYLLMLSGTLICMKASKKPLREFGLFKENIPKQMIIGMVIASILLGVSFITGWRPGLKEDFLYIVLSQMLVAFSEELLFRGFVLGLIKDVVSSKNMTVFVSALLFGLWHYPIGHSVGQVISAFVIGGIFGALRTVFDEKDEIGVPSIAIAHWLYNAII